MRGVVVLEVGMANFCSFSKRLVAKIYIEAMVAAFKGTG
jgi:hypothetical protein